MTMYKAICTAPDGQKLIIESDYASKKAFAYDLRKNGYKVNNNKVHTKAKWDWVMENTNALPWDWRECPIK